MSFDIDTIRQYAMPLVSQLEGPYKWYIMVGVAFILTAFITRFIFKTFKWVVLLVVVMGLMFGGLYVLSKAGTPVNPERVIDQYLNEEAN